MKRRILAGLLCAAMAFGLVACGDSKAAAGKEEDNTQEEEEASILSTDEHPEEPEYVPAEVTTPLMTFDIADYVTLGDYSNMNVTLTDDYEVSEEDIANDVNYTLQFYSDTQKTDKTVVETGDIANIDYEGKKDGVAFDGGTAQGYDLEIGSGQFIPGFEDGLIGVRVGETVDLDLTFPEAYGSAELAGQAVVFTVTVNYISERKTMTYDDLTDEYVSANLGYDTVDAYLESVKASLTEEFAANRKAEIRANTLEQLVDDAEIRVPDGLLSQKVEQWIQMFQNQAGADDIYDYLINNYNMTLDEFRERITEEMSGNLKQELALQKLADELGVEVTDAELDAYIDSLMEDSSASYESKEQLLYVYATNYESAQDYLRNNYRYTQTLDKLVEMVTVE